MAVSFSRGKTLSRKAAIRKTEKGRMDVLTLSKVLCTYGYLLGKKYLEFIGRHGRKGTFLNTFIIMSTLYTQSHFNLHNITKRQMSFYPFSW